uniref:Capsid protein n=1 Tax=Parvoviridae sp. TaxID=1940570 RepID=A0A7D3QKG6_9VIRU|nr:MAG: capsid protein [Parvoviridae sp.]
MVRKGITLPGYKYVGPFNSLDNGQPVNALDAAAREHDINYGDPNINTMDADEALAHQAGESDTYAGTMVQGIMGLKSYLDPMSLMDNILRTEPMDESGTPGPSAPCLPGEAPAAGGDTNNLRGGGGGVSSGGMAGYVPKLSATHVPPYTRTFKHRHEYTIWNKQSQPWSYVTVGSPADATVGYGRGSDYFSFMDRSFAFYLNNRQMEQFLRTAVAFRPVSAGWSIKDSQVYVHNLQDGTLKYANYQNVNPKIYVLQDENIIPPINRLGVDALESTAAAPVPTIDDVAMLEHMQSAKCSSVLMPRVYHQYNYATTQAVPVGTGIVGQTPDHMGVIYSDGDATHDFEFRCLDSIIAQDMVGFERSVQTWQYPIRNPKRLFYQGRGYQAPPIATQQTQQTPAGCEWVDMGSCVANAFSDLSFALFPVGPVIEKHYAQMNPITNCADAAGMNRGTPPVQFKVEDIKAPDGTYQHVSVKFVIESYITMEIYDDTCSVGLALDGSRNFVSDMYLKGVNRFTGVNFALGNNVHDWNSITTPANYTVLKDNIPNYTGTSTATTVVPRYVQDTGARINTTFNKDEKNAKEKIKYQNY